MRNIFIILFMSVGSALMAQSDSNALKERVAQLDKAIVEKDTATLGKILHKDMSFGHSTGWVQTKDELQNDLQSGKLAYLKLETTKVTIPAIHKDWATVRTTTNAEAVTSENSVKTTLHVLQVWIKTKEGWKLIARQATRLPQSQ